MTAYCTCSYSLAGGISDNDPECPLHGDTELMRRYMAGEITAEEYLRLIHKATAARVRREQRVRRWWRDGPVPNRSITS